MDKCEKRFINSAGERCQVKHEWNRLKIQFGEYCVDGLCEVDNTIFLLEYDGCHVHKNCSKCGIQDPKKIEV